jgi:ribonuclease R
MIAANETVDTYLHYLGIDSLHRVHEKPDEKKISQFISFINSLGYRIKGKSKHFDAYAMQEILKILQSDESWSVLSNLALRTMKKAKYSPENLGHFGLGEEFYAHFTAPIRRESDRVIHRILKASLGVPGYRKHSFEELVVIGDHVSLTEERSVKCERATDKMKSAEYMEERIGEEYDAIISSISRDGIWVQLDNLIEGLIKISDIGNDYFDFDEKIQIVKGRKTGKVYRIGEKIRVVVTDASKEESEIDFAFVKKKNK